MGAHVWGYEEVCGGRDGRRYSFDGEVRIERRGQYQVTLWREDHHYHWMINDGWGCLVDSGAQRSEGKARAAVSSAIRSHRESALV